MNGIHDMGGMQGMGEIGYEEDAPMFHADWEVRVQALHAASGSFRGGPLRPTIEQIPAAAYLQMTYYERWLTALIERLVQSGISTRDEIEQGRADAGTARADVTVGMATAADWLLRTPRTERQTQVEARFEVGDRVRGRNIHPAGHTRMPRYTRLRTGSIERDRGVFMLPDSEGPEPRPQHVYLVRFSARELWGETAHVRDSVRIDMWEDYLEPA
ncbi:MAG: nitrile hydratase subunit beta [Gammaproteobacteria bacterium]|nr:nitrile hydratase subunit beta [Gammaproteobacteria bacterium]